MRGMRSPDDPVEWDVQPTFAGAPRAGGPSAADDSTDDGRGLARDLTALDTPLWSASTFSKNRDRLLRDEALSS
jgi:hypothetical protein